MKKWTFKCGLVACLMTLAVLCRAAPDVSQYRYSQTKQLVRFVHEAAELFHKEGRKAFPKFREHDGKWYYKSRYIFIYDLQGKNIFNPAGPSHEERNFLHFKDLNGVPVIHEMLAIVNNKKNPEGWLHYLWTGPDHLFPAWKSSYIMRVTGPDGKAYVIGSGIYDSRNEQAFIEDLVGRVANLLQDKGLGLGLKILLNQSHAYRFKGFYPFVLDMKGRALFDPAFPDKKKSRNLISLVDAVGKPFIEEAINKMKQKPSAWVMYMMAKPNHAGPTKKMLYVRRVEVGGKIVVVGSGMSVETPIWAR